VHHHAAFLPAGLEQHLAVGRGGDFRPHLGNAALVTFPFGCDDPHAASGTIKAVASSRRIADLPEIGRCPVCFT